MGSDDERLRVLFIATGYPTIDRPSQCIFVHRSIKALSSYVDAKVIHLRAWLPGRSFIKKSYWEDIPVVTVSCPQSLSGKNSHLNSKILAWFGRIFARPYLKVADVIHSTELYSAGFVASQWAGITGKPLTTQAIGSDLNFFLARHLPRIGEKWLLSVNGVACNSSKILKQVNMLLPNHPNVDVIYRGVDPVAFSPKGPKRGPQTLLPPARFLYLGGFHTWDPRRPEFNLKGGHNLLKAWQQVETQIQPSNLLIGGPGTDLVKLEKWRSSLCYPESVSLVRTIKPDDVPSFIRACDVVVIPSLYEGLPNLANEAQACGRPVLGSDAGSIAESVVHGETGLVVPRGNIEALASGLRWFYAHQTEIRKIGTKARKRMIKQFSWDQFSEKMIVLFNESIKLQNSHSIRSR